MTTVISVNAYCKKKKMLTAPVSDTYSCGDMYSVYLTTRGQ